MASNEFELKAKADLRDLTAAFQQVFDQTEKDAKRSATAALKEWKKTQRAMQKSANNNKQFSGTAKGAKQAADSMKQMSQASSSLGESTEKLSGLLRNVNPEVGDLVTRSTQVVKAFSGVTRAGATLAIGLGAITAALAAGAAAWTYLNHKMEEAEERNKRMAEQSAKMQADHTKLAEIELEVAVMTGKMTEEEAKLTRGRIKAQKAYAPFVEHTQQQLQNITNQIIELNKQEGDHQFEVTRLAKRYGELSGRLQEYEGKITVAGVALSGANEKHKQQAKALAEIAAKQREANAEAVRAQQIAEARDKTAQSMLAADYARAELERARNVELIEFESMYRKVQEQRTEAEEGKRKAQEAVLAGVQSQVSAAAGLFAMLQNHDKVLAEGKRRAFVAEKAANIAQATMLGAVAFNKALGSAPPPFNAIAAALVATSAATQVATIAAQPMPSFHTGGSLDRRALAPDETMARVTKDEEVVTRKDQSQPLIVHVEQRYGHRAFNSFVRDDVRRGGELYKAMRNGKRRGHK